MISRRKVERIATLDGVTLCFMIYLGSREQSQPGATSTGTAKHVRSVISKYALPRSYGGLQRFGLHGAMPHNSGSASACRLTSVQVIAPLGLPSSGTYYLFLF